MKKTYHFLRQSIWVILVELVFIGLLSAVSFIYLFDSATDTLPLSHVIVILLILLTLGAIGTAIFVCIKAENVGVTRIKKTNKFILFAEAFTVIMMLAFFIYECLTSMVYAESDSKALVLFRVTRWILSIPAFGYFLLQAFPKKIGRARIHIPTILSIITSLSLILWSILGIFTTYFASHLKNPNDVTKISMMFIYVVISAFFIFEGEFRFVKTVHMPYMMSAFFTSIVTFAIPFGISIAKIVRAELAYDALSQSELLTCVAIGVYALAKMFSLVSTMGFVIENSHGKNDGERRKPKTEKVDAEQ